MDACSGDGVRWSNGGSRAATSGSETAANGSGADDAAQIQALLHSLSQVRLAVSADLSAAAGALEDDRADIAADVIAGARRELAEFRAAAHRREFAPSRFPRKVPVVVGGSGAAEPPVASEFRIPAQGIRPRQRLVRALAGTAALAVVIAVVPQVVRGGSHPSNGATGAPQSPNIRLASSEFTVLSQRLLAADASPATIVAAERSWQGAVATSLPTASTNVATASAVVAMLREERALLLASPALRAPADRTLTTSLAASSQSLLTRLRQLADPQVLAILPTVLNALPLAVPSTTTAPSAGATPAPGTGTAPTGPTSSTGAGSGSLPTPTVQSTGATNPSAPPSAPASDGPLPDPGNVLPVPLPSTLGQLTGGGTVSGGLGQTVGDVLQGLGLGG
jgi:hypothetical protein